MIVSLFRGQRRIIVEGMVDGATGCRVFGLFETTADALAGRDCGSVGSWELSHEERDAARHNRDEITRRLADR